ncbi:MAG: ATP-dependent helicase [Bacteroidetes bacterium]|nr:MAG: ATP-dependent helicase [Bacteroidota bacterium]
MNTFDSFNLSKPLRNAIVDLGFERPTPIQEETFSVILSGKDVVGIAQTGTGKTFAYMLPILQNLKFSKQITPRVLVLVPTRELVLQMVDMIESFAKYINVRVLGVYGGTNINVQKQAVAKGCDILVATPGRLYDLAVSNTLRLKDVNKLVIDEVDVMLDLGFIRQLTNIFDLLRERRQNIMFSATMTEEVDALINDFFVVPAKVSIAVSGTPLDNIAQQCYPVKNFYTKVNLLKHLINDKDVFTKVLVFVSNKKNADRLYEALQEDFISDVCIIHSNKSQNFRIRSINQFDEGENRVLVATDVMARGLDLDKISHVINFDTPNYPENYMHRIGRTGRAEEEGKTILFFTEKEQEAKVAIEKLMIYEIPMMEFPQQVEISNESIPEERTKTEGNYNRNTKLEVRGAAFHEKKEKNLKVNQGGSYKFKMKTYKKPKTRGDKIKNRKKKGKR